MGSLYRPNINGKPTPGQYNHLYNIAHGFNRGYKSQKIPTTVLTVYPTRLFPRGSSFVAPIQHQDHTPVVATTCDQNNICNLPRYGLPLCI